MQMRFCSQCPPVVTGTLLSLVPDLVVENANSCAKYFNTCTVFAIYKASRFNDFTVLDLRNYWYQMKIFCGLLSFVLLKSNGYFVYLK